MQGIRTILPALLSHNLQRGLVRSVGLVLVGMSLCASAARAEYITYQFTGIVNSVDATLGGNFQVNDLISGTYTVDSSVAARAGSDSQFAVYDALVSLNLTVGSYSASLSGGPGPEIQVDNDPPSPNVDRYGLVARAADGLTGPALDGGALLLDGFLFRMDDDTDTVFSDALIFPASISLADFSSSSFFLFFRPVTGLDPVALSGVFTSLERVSAVPEPASLVMLATFGLVGAGTISRRSRRAA